MNEFLLLKLGVRILAGTSPANVKTQVAGWFTEAGWQVLNSSTATVLDVIPPASQQIGNALGADVLRIQFNAGDVTLRTAMLMRTPQLKRWYISGNTSGTSGSVKIGTQTVSTSGATGGYDNLTSKMYDALRLSTAPEASAYSYELVIGPGANDDYIIATEKAVGGGLAIANASGFQVYQWADSQAVGSVVDRGASLANNKFKFAINYGVDWVIFLSLTTRSAVMAIRTTTGGFVGPFGASWMRQDDATGQCPKGCAPVQLALADLGNASNVRVDVRFGHSYGYTVASAPSGVYGGGVLDGSVAYQATTTPRNLIAEVAALGFPAGLSAVNTSILGANASTALAGLLTPGGAGTSGSNSTQLWIPGAVLPDLCVFFAAGDNETTMATRTTAARTTLTQPVDAAATTIPLVDTSFLAPKGTVIIGSEIINYTSIKDGALLGCERGKASTQAAPHGTTEDVFRAFWWIRMNWGALPAGPIDPAML